MNCFSSSPTSSAHCQEQMLDIISATCHRENTAYRVYDWLRNDERTHHGPLHVDAVDRHCRSKMIAWCVQIVDFCKLSRETVEITMSLLDRFVSTSAGAKARNDRLTYQLACMAALYTAAKIHEPMAISPKMMAQFSHGLFTTEDIEKTESILLGALQWRVNPPTSWDFIRMLMDLLSTTEQVSLSQELRCVVSDLAFQQAELAVANDQFITVKASTVAYAAVLNALESVGAGMTTLKYLSLLLAQPLHLDANPNHAIMLVQDNLFLSVVQGHQQNGNVCSRIQSTKCTGGSNINGVSQITSFVETSPRAISHAHCAYKQ